MEKSEKKWNKFHVFMLAVMTVAMLFSCASSPIDGRSEIVGRVLDSSGKPLPCCTITLDGMKKATTNSSGIFVFRDVSSGNHKIVVEKENYSTEKREFSFISRQTFLTVKCKNGTEVFDEIENYLDQRDLVSAKSCLKSLKKCDGNEKLFCFYESLLEYLEKPNEKRKSKLTMMITRR